MATSAEDAKAKRNRFIAKVGRRPLMCPGICVRRRVRTRVRARAYGAGVCVSLRAHAGVCVRARVRAWWVGGCMA